MIKRIIACLTICLIITGLISPVFSHAEPIPIYTPNWDNPGIAEIINISDLTGWMANGGVYDITSFQNLDEFLTWYFKIRVPVQDEDGNITFAPTYGYETYFDSSYNSPRFIEQSNIRGMIGRSYQNKTGYGRRLQEQVDKALLEDGDLSNVNIPLLSLAESAYFIGHNTEAIDFYKSLFDIGISVNPDPDYETLLDVINGSGFYFKNWANGYFSSNPYYTNYPLSNYSYVSVNNSFGDGNTNYGTISQLTEIITININSDGNGNYSAYIPYTMAGNAFAYTSSMRSLYGRIGPNLTWIAGNGSPNTGDTASYKDFPSSSLYNILSSVASYFRNVNIYVDGEAWSLVSTPSPIVPEFPDVVGGDELPTTTWPLTIPKAPSYINLPGLRQAFQRAKNTDNQFDIMDLTDSLVDPEGDPIEDPEMETVPIPLPNPDPINPEVVPELPELPLIPPANNPGFSGVSVLAEIINFTNQSLPSALITVFWGIVFGAVILGIIKILHK